MNGREMLQASIALMEWFKSQEIDQRDALMVMGTAIAAVVTMYPKAQQPIARDAFIYGLSEAIELMGSFS